MNVTERNVRCHPAQYLHKEVIHAGHVDNGCAGNICDLGRQRADPKQDAAWMNLKPLPALLVFRSTTALGALGSDLPCVSAASKVGMRGEIQYSSVIEDAGMGTLQPRWVPINSP